MRISPDCPARRAAHDEDNDRTIELLVDIRRSKNGSS
jgi:hypothetical protein